MPTRAPALPALAALLLAGCTDDNVSTLTPVEDWTTEPAYEIGNPMPDDMFFGPYLDIRATADNSTVYVLDLQASEVTIWTTDGTLVRRLGRPGEGPGEFQDAGRITLTADGFYVRDLRGITLFTSDGDLVDTRLFPLDVSYRNFPAQVQDHLGDGSFVALPSPFVLDASSTSEPADHLPVLRVVQGGDAWRTEEMALLNFRDWQASLTLEGAPSPFPIGQPWVTPDAFAADHTSGSLIVKHAAASSPGLIDLTEVSTGGDTLWTRALRLPPMPLTEAQIDAEVDEWAAMIASSMGRDNASPALKGSLREAWLIPEHWPVAREIRLMSNGEIWFEHLGHDPPGVWYAVRKGADEGPVRCITVPESFQPLDATATHLWGIRRDELDVGYVTGLRLLPSQALPPVSPQEPG